MFCSNCTSDCLQGPYYAADRVTRRPQAYMSCRGCGATFDAYESYGVVEPGYPRPVAA